MQLHALAGADGLTLNLHDYLCRTAAAAARIPEMVCKAARLRWRPFSSCAGQDDARRGPVPWRGTRALHRQRPLRTPDGMLPARPLDAVLPLLGVPVQFTPAATNVLLGDDVLCYKKAELGSLPAREGLMVDNIAAEHLCTMGFRTAAGLRAGRPHRGACVEQISSAEYARQVGGHAANAPIGRPCAGRARGSHLRGGGRRAGDPAACWMRGKAIPLAPPPSSPPRFENALGGIVCVLAAPVRSLWAWLCRGRRTAARPAARDAGLLGCPLWKGDANLRPLYYEDARGGGLLGLSKLRPGRCPRRAADGLRLENALDDTDAEPLRLSP